MKKLIFITVIAFGLGSIGCKTQKVESDYTRLSESTWNVIDLEKKVVEKTQNNPFITFDTNEMRVSGSGGCNRISGTFKSQPNSDQISFSQMITTRMACLNMETENTFLNLIGKVSFFKIENDTLTLYDSNRNELISLIKNK